MDELVIDIPMDDSASGNTFFLATVGSVTSSGITLRFAGQNEASQKKYKRLKTGATLYSGDRVLLAKMAGTYVVLGKIAYS